MIRVCSSCAQKNRIPWSHVHVAGRCGRCREEIAPIDRPIDVKSSAQFQEIIDNAEVPILVDFWAAWCGPCRLAAPRVTEVASRRAGRAVVLKVDTERMQDLAARFQIQGIPNFMVFEGGEVKREQAGLVDVGVMEGWLD